MGCSFVRSVLAWENIVVKSEKVKTVSVSHHLLPWLFRFTTANSLLNHLFKAVVLKQGRLCPQGDI